MNKMPMTPTTYKNGKIEISGDPEKVNGIIKNEQRFRYIKWFIVFAFIVLVLIISGWQGVSPEIIQIIRNMVLLLKPLLSLVNFSQLIFSG